MVGVGGGISEQLVQTVDIVVIVSGVVVLVLLPWLVSVGHIRAIGSKHGYCCYCERCCRVGVTVIAAPRDCTGPQKTALPRRVRA